MSQKPKKVGRRGGFERPYMRSLFFFLPVSLPWSATHVRNKFDPSSQSLARNMLGPVCPERSRRRALCWSIAAIAVSNPANTRYSIKSRLPVPKPLVDCWTLRPALRPWCFSSIASVFFRRVSFIADTYIEDHNYYNKTLTMVRTFNLSLVSVNLHVCANFWALRMKRKAANGEGNLLTSDEYRNHQDETSPHIPCNSCLALRCFPSPIRRR